MGGRGDGTAEREGIDRLARWLVEAGGASVAFTGAGISADSGIATFRGSGGIWERYPPEEFGTALGLARAFVVRFDAFRGFVVAAARSFLDAEPSAGHRALAGLERRGIVRRVVTQNVDGLHELAGSERVVLLHGSFFRARCRRCGRDREVSRAEIDSLVRRLELARGRFSLARAYRRHGVRCGSCGGPTRPDLVLFGESLPEGAYEEAAAEAESCRLLLVVGTSGVVRPASDIPYIALHAGARIVEVNPEPTDLTPLADLRIPMTAARCLPLVVERVGAALGR